MLELLNEAKKELKPIGQTDLLEYAEELGLLGFFMLQKQMLAKHYGYIKVSPQQIKDFLISKFKTRTNEKVGYIWEERPTDPTIKFYVGNQREATTEEIKELEIRWRHNTGYLITQILNWHEFPIDTYGKVPPDNIIEKFKVTKDRNIFNHFTIAELSFTRKITAKMVDPLLLGHINGTEDWYILGQWDDDILIDDLI